MNPLDRHLLLALRSVGDPSDPLGPPWLQRAAVDFTALGSHTVLAVMAICVAGWLVLRRRYISALWLVPVTVGAMLLNHGLKTVFARPRPDIVEHLVEAASPSFPSGHALLSAAVYLTLALVLGREIDSPALRGYLMVVALLLTLTIGVSRIFLGVHWPSDVLGGWIIGSLWAWGCHAAGKRIDPHRHLPRQ